ncbi:unnamed protein product [Staurois parvus]|uniref:Uncharacterized protein n=1 Tax=Staurois parvus TaxID=386267 RepID=A0ABN9CJS2_9NEOB|nr:unnamed protein product [Staurois parvus]
MYIHTHRHMYIHTDTHTQTHVQTRRHMYKHADTCTRTHVHVHTPSPHKQLQYFVITHRAGYCTLGGGREHSTHSLRLLSVRSAIEQSDVSQCQ